MLSKQFLFIHAVSGSCQWSSNCEFAYLATLLPSLAKAFLNASCLPDFSPTKVLLTMGYLPVCPQFLRALTLRNVYGGVAGCIFFSVPDSELCTCISLSLIITFNKRQFVEQPSHYFLFPAWEIPKVSVTISSRPALLPVSSREKYTLLVLAHWCV